MDKYLILVSIFLCPCKLSVKRTKLEIQDYILKFKKGNLISSICIFKDFFFFGGGGVPDIQGVFKGCWNPVTEYSRSQRLVGWLF